MKILPEPSPGSSSPTIITTANASNVNTTTSASDSTKTEVDPTSRPLEKENLHRPEMERVSSQDDCDRQPQAAGANEKTCNVAVEKRKTQNLKNTVVNKLSEKLGE